MGVEAYQGYTSNGIVIPIGNPSMPNGLRVIITVLDQPSVKDCAGEQKKALENFKKGLDACPPLPSGFGEIISARVNIARELEL
ncbi:hypothetical protein FACS1894216_22770 [Synergistales bacterium]|nr:hypothetical protein FACS1894216_22770 [Synergistales bacterium]